MHSSDFHKGRMTWVRRTHEGLCVCNLSVYVSLSVRQRDGPDNNHATRQLTGVAFTAQCELTD